MINEIFVHFSDFDLHGSFLFIFLFLSKHYCLHPEIFVQIQEVSIFVRELHI